MVEMAFKGIVGFLEVKVQKGVKEAMVQLVPKETKDGAVIRDKGVLVVNEGKLEIREMMVQLEKLDMRYVAKNFFSKLFGHI